MKMNKMNKKSLMMFLMCLFGMVPLCMSAETLRGDVNGNGSVDINDVSMMIDYLLSSDA